MLTRRLILHAAVSAGALVVPPARSTAQGVGADDALGFTSAVALARMIRAREISARELTQYFIGRIERFDGAINAVVVRDFDRALAAAAEADATLARGDAVGSLHGVPMTVKESWDVAGLPKTFGVPFLRDNVAQRDADVVAKLEAAGAIVLGKTNVPEGMSDMQTVNPIYGETGNPWDLTRTPGGSSGGAAAAVAAGLVGLETGSDIGGSVRNPAHYCGVYAHKPTWGIIPRRGESLPGRREETDMAVAGPLGRSAEDLALAFDVLAGPSHWAAPGWRLDLPASRADALSGLRVAVWATDEVCPVARVISDRVQDVADALARAGASVSDAARPDFDVRAANGTYLTLLGAAGAGNGTDAMYAEAVARAEALPGDERSMLATRLRGRVIDNRGWQQADEARLDLRRRWRAFFEDWDVLVCPIAVTTAPEKSAVPATERTVLVDGVERLVEDQLFWAGLATCSYLPATAFPAGLAADGLPIGLQAMSAEYADRTTIAFASLIADVIGGYAPPPGYGD